MKAVAITAGVLVSLAPAGAQAQVLRCAVPSGPLATPRPDLPSADQPQRRLPIGGYTLALTWSPQYCRTNAGDPSARLQCGAGNRFGFTLHGLWPDGEGKDWPQYCGAAQLLDTRTLAQHLCATPSVQLLQHEWAKHGTCMATKPAAYFGTANRLYGALRFPDMAMLSRRPLTVGQFTQAMAWVNPGLAPEMMRITIKRGGWLDEAWLCLDKRLRYAACPSHQGGVPATARLQIWRGPR